MTILLSVELGVPQFDSEVCGLPLFAQLRCEAGDTVSLPYKDDLVYNGFQVENQDPNITLSFKPESTKFKKNAARQEPIS